MNADSDVVMVLDLVGICSGLVLIVTVVVTNIVMLSEIAILFSLVNECR